MIINLGQFEKSKRTTIVWEDSSPPTSIQVSKNGAPFVPASNAVGTAVLVTPGVYSFVLESSDTGIAGPLLVRIVGGTTTNLMLQISSSVSTTISTTTIMQHVTAENTKLDQRISGLIRDIVGVGIEDIKSKMKKNDHKGRK